MNRKQRAAYRVLRKRIHALSAWMRSIWPADKLQPFAPRWALTPPDPRAKKRDVERYRRRAARRREKRERKDRHAQKSSG